MDEINKELVALGNRLDQIDARLDAIDAKLDRILALAPRPVPAVARTADMRF